MDILTVTPANVKTIYSFNALDTFLLLIRAFSLSRCEEHSDEAIPVDLVGNEIATPRQVGARNDTPVGE